MTFHRFGSARRTAYSARLKRERRQRMAWFAELVANGETVKGAAAIVGVTQATGTSMMAEMRRDLGWQAR